MTVIINLPGISPCGLLLYATFLVVFQNFSSLLACVLLFSILLTCCFQLVWQVYINIVIYHHELLSLVRGFEVIFPQTMMKWLYCHELVPRASLVWRGCTMRIRGRGLFLWDTVGDISYPLQPLRYNFKVSLFTLW
jgi:hypothetical protein